MRRALSHCSHHRRSQLDDDDSQRSFHPPLPHVGLVLSQDNAACHDCAAAHSRQRKLNFFHHLEALSRAGQLLDACKKVSSSSAALMFL